MSKGSVLNTAFKVTGRRPTNDGYSYFQTQRCTAQFQLVTQKLNKNFVMLCEVLCRLPHTASQESQGLSRLLVTISGVPT